MQEKSSNALLVCPQCKSQHIISGELANLSGRNQLIIFKSDNRKNFLARLLVALRETTASPYIFVEFASHLCTDCGLLWSRVDPNVAKQHLRAYGTENLKAHLELSEPEV